MKRLHIHVGVKDLEKSIRFYRTLFGADPAKVKGDYAKWMLEDPRINFAISTRASSKGVDHLGLQVDEGEELELIRTRLKEADMALLDEGQTTCCYARSEKSWVQDPDGLAWEAYQTMEDAELFSKAKVDTAKACCA
jgi:catechol 2,3-dioxygenase-like lactoylglutathione lyase family enzyme